MSNLCEGEGGSILTHLSALLILHCLHLLLELPSAACVKTIASTNPMEVLLDAVDKCFTKVDSFVLGDGYGCPQVGRAQWALAFGFFCCKSTCFQVHHAYEYGVRNTDPVG